MILEPVSESLLISLSTYPNFNLEGYLGSIEKVLYQVKNKRLETYDFSDDNEKKSYESKYYNCLAYHIVGAYSLCVLTVADTSQLITKVMHPDMDIDYISLGSVHSKTYTGISFQNIGAQYDDFVQLNSNSNIPYVGICHFKLNNNWLCNGYEFITSALKYVNKKLNGNIFFIINSFGTYEITLVLFGGSIEQISKTISELRETLITNLDNYETLFNCSTDIEDSKGSHVFIDSHTYFGIKLKKENNKYILEKNEIGNNNIYYEVECKPGHEHKLKDEIKNIYGKLKPKIYFEAGHYDYLIYHKDNHKVYGKIFQALRDENSTLKKHIRKFKTKILIEHLNENTNNCAIVDYKQFGSFNLNDINNDLRKVKIPKTTRNQIVKLFYNFQNTLQDPIIAPLFYDLYFRLEEFRIQINNWSNEIKTGGCPRRNMTVFDVAEICQKLITPINDAFMLRYVNDYTLEEVPDFLLPNAQLQNLNYSYEGYFKLISSIFLDEEKGDINPDQLIINFDEYRAEASRTNVKIATYNIFEPGLFFTVSSKEILNLKMVNRPEKTNDELIINENTFKDLISDFFIKNADSPAFDIKDQIINYDIKYSIIDYYRFITFFDKDEKLFLFYHIGYVFQYPFNYNLRGDFADKFLIIELFRLYVLSIVVEKKLGLKSFGFDKVKSMCPNPETQGKWEFYSKKIINFLESDIYNEDYGCNEKNKDRIIKPILLELDKINIDNFKLSKIDQGSFDRFEHIIKLDSSKSDILDNINSMAFYYMKKVSDKSDGSPKILARNWKDGGVDVEFCKLRNEKQDYYFLFDVQGGSFFTNFKSINEFSILRNRVLLSLMHYSYFYKNELKHKILNYTKNLNDETRI